MGPMCLVIMIGFIAIAGLLFLVLITLRPFQQEKAWRELAARTGLEYQPEGSSLGVQKPGRVAGTYRGYKLTLDTFTNAEDDVYMRIVLLVNNPANGYLLMQCLSPGDRGFRKLFGRGIDTGDERFTEQFVIKESQPKDFAGKVFASRRLRSSLCRQMHAGGYRIEMSGQELKLEPYSPLVAVERNVARLQSLFDVLCDVAKGVAKARSPHAKKRCQKSRKFSKASRKRNR